MTRRVTKVVAYVTRGTELLVFSQPASPEAGLQVPAGTVRPGEAIEAAVHREAREETGLPGLVLDRYLGERELDTAPFDREEIHERHFFHLTLTGDAPPVWSHLETSGGEADPIKFAFRWHDLQVSVPVLIADQGALLHRLPMFSD